MASSRLLWASRAASYLRISVSAARPFSSVVKGFKYTDSHEWVKVDGNAATIGITDHAQNHLGDVVYVELPDAGVAVKQGAGFGAVESVKATSDVNSPVSGTVLEVNEELKNSPGLGLEPKKFQYILDPVVFDQVIFHTSIFVTPKVNSSPYEKGWIIKVSVSDAGELNKLKASDEYSKFCEEEDAKH